MEDIPSNVEKQIHSGDKKESLGTRTRLHMEREADNWASDEEDRGTRRGAGERETREERDMVPAKVDGTDVYSNSVVPLLVRRK